MSDSEPQAANPKSKIQDPKSPEHLILGQVVAPFGVQGAVKATIYTEFPERVGKLEGVVLAPFDAVDEEIVPSAALDPATLRGRGARDHGPGVARAVPGPREATVFGVESASVHKGQLILKLAGVESVEEAGGLRGYWVMVPREQAKRLPRGSYYLYQLVGLEVYDTEGAHIGQVNEIITSAANDVYVVRGEGVKEQSGELLVPAIRAVVKKIDVDGGRMVIAPVSEWA